MTKLKVWETEVEINLYQEVDDLREALSHCSTQDGWQVDDVSNTRLYLTKYRDETDDEYKQRMEEAEKQQSNRNLLRQAQLAANDLKPVFLAALRGSKNEAWWKEHYEDYLQKNGERSLIQAVMTEVATKENK